MPILWKYLYPYRWLAAFALTLAGLAQILALVDPIIFGKLIDEYAANPGQKTESEKIRGVLWLLGLAVGVAVLSNIAKAFQEYFTRRVVQKFGIDIFNDGLKQTL
ncbi:MAG TPA: ABC transporter ATP-binding protein, partial [Fibrella sp.]